MDQREISRPQADACDIGAYEFALFALPETHIPYLIFLQNSTCRERPGDQYTPLAYIEAGQSANVIGINPNQNWFQVKDPAHGIVCWVYEEQVEFFGDLSRVRVVGPDAEKEPPPSDVGGGAAP